MNAIIKTAKKMKKQFMYFKDEYIYLYDDAKKIMNVETRKDELIREQVIRFKHGNDFEGVDFHLSLKLLEKINKHLNNDCVLNIQSNTKPIRIDENYIIMPAMPKPQGDIIPTLVDEEESIEIEIEKVVKKAKVKVNKDKLKIIELNDEIAKLKREIYMLKRVQ